MAAVPKVEIMNLIKYNFFHSSILAIFIPFFSLVY